MGKFGKSFLSQVISDGIKGPFVTIMLNTHVGHQNVEKDQIKFKNFAKDAKRRFEKKYPEHSWDLFQTKIDELLADQSFWRNSTTSVAVIITPEEVLVHRLSIRVDDQYYVGETPYVLAVIKNAQFNYPFYLLALNRDSMQVYQVENNQVREVELPEEAPTTIEKALGKKSLVVVTLITVLKVALTQGEKALLITALVPKMKKSRSITSTTTKQLMHFSRMIFQMKSIYQCICLHYQKIKRCLKKWQKRTFSKQNQVFPLPQHRYP